MEDEPEYIDDGSEESTPEEEAALPHLLIPADWGLQLDLNEIYGNEHSLEVELGCGKGRFVATRAQKNPDINYLAVERMKGRAFATADKFRRRDLSNARVLRIEAAYTINALLPPNSIDVLYVFFPDPWPKRRHHTRRLFNDDFMTSLCRTLKPGACVYLNTDHKEYFEVIYELLETHDRFRAVDPVIPSDDEQTGFEMVFLKQGLDIHRIGYEFTG